MYVCPLSAVYVTVPVLPPVVVSGATLDTVPDVFLPFETRTPLFSTVDEYVSTTYREAEAGVARSESKSYPMNLQEDVPVHAVMALFNAAGIMSSVTGVGFATSGNLRSTLLAALSVSHRRAVVVSVPVTPGGAHGATPLILYPGVFFSFIIDIWLGLWKLPLN